MTARVAGFYGRFARGASPAEIGTVTVVSPAFSKLKVKSYVSPLVIGLDSAPCLGGVGLLGGLQRRDLAVRLADHQHAVGGQRGVAGEADRADVGGDRDQLVGDVRRAVDRDEHQLDLAAGLHVVGGLRGAQVDVAQRDRPTVARAVHGGFLGRGLGHLPGPAAGERDGGGEPAGGQPGGGEQKYAV